MMTTEPETRVPLERMFSIAALVFSLIAVGVSVGVNLQKIDHLAELMRTHIDAQAATEASRTTSDRGLVTKEALAPELDRVQADILELRTDVRELLRRIPTPGK